MKLRRRRQGERQKSNRFTEQNNNSARALRFSVHFFAVPAQLQGLWVRWPKRTSTQENCTGVYANYLIFQYRQTVFLTTGK